MNDSSTVDARALDRGRQALQRLQIRLAELEDRAAAPIAIVGMACRLPGHVTTPDEYWQLLCREQDAITPIPRERWSGDAYFDADPKAPGRTYAAHGGFVEGIDRFDAGLFDISPREAEHLDPQQRMLLEETWTALEDSGDLSVKLTGSRTGVFVGMATRDYERRHMSSPDSARIDVHSLTGSAPCIASGRIAYALGLQGPAITVDTACSSSLVAVHLACQSLRERDCDLAIVAGVNALLDPALSIYLSRARALSHVGKCRAFDEAADGFVRSEGCAVIILRRLGDATARRDRIRAVIRGSALNNDGKSNGLTAPNGAAQRRLVSDALRAARVEADQVGYVETHGTGTPLGDPIEFGAIAAVFGQRPAQVPPLLIGSVKTNIGHLEAAAGIAGLMKVVLSLEQGQIPAHLHLKKRNPYLGAEDAPIVIPDTLTPWPAHERRIAGVSAFGFSGTNAHVVIEQAPAREDAPARPGPSLLTVSARSDKALRELASRYVAWLARPDAPPLASVCDTANAGRMPLPIRSSIVAESNAELSVELQRLVDGGHLRSAANRRPSLVFLFSGQGSYDGDLVRRLKLASPTFRASMESFSRMLVALGEPPLDDAMSADVVVRSSARRAQPALFAVQMSLVALWKALGVRPSGVLGHSLGEYAAACTAGLVSSECGLALVVARARLMDELAAPGSMWRVQLDEARMSEALRAHPRVSIAAHNGPDDLVISGSDEALAPLLEALRADGIRVKRLDVTHAFHSEQMQPVLDAFQRAVSEVTFDTPQLVIHSGLLGRPATAGEIASAEYWRDHLRRPVRFAAALRAATDGNPDGFVEIGLLPQLIALGKRLVGEDAPLWLPSAQRGGDVLLSLLRGLGQIFERGGDFDADALSRELGPSPKAALPTYPFERRRYWLDATDALGSNASSAYASPHKARWYELRPVESPALDLLVFATSFDLAEMPLVADHRVRGGALVNLVVYLTLISSAFELGFGKPCAQVVDFFLGDSLILSEGQGQDVQVLLEPQANGAAFRVVSRVSGARTGSPWRVHATGTAQERVIGEGSAPLPVRSAKARELSVRDFYEQLAQREVDLGPACRGLEALFVDGSTSSAVLECAKQPKPGEPEGIPLALIDSAFQSTMVPCLSDSTPRIIVGFRSLCLHGPWRLAVCARAEQRVEAGGAALARLDLFDQAGARLVSCEGVRFQPLRGRTTGSSPSKAQSSGSLASAIVSSSVARRALSALSSSQRLAFIDSFLRDALTEVLHIAREDIADLPLSRVGLDSFMAMELVERILQATGVRASLLDILDDATVPSLSAAIAGKLVSAEPVAASPARVEAMMEEGSI